MSRAVLELQGLNKSFGALHATRDLSFCVNAGEIHALIGPNGAGKTTLIQQIYGALKPDTGHVLLNGKDITSLPVPGRVRAGIGRSFQISNVLMDFTVLENGIIAEQARLGQSFRFLRPAFNDPDLIAGARKILAPVGLDDRTDQLVGDLAHGERRMLELALALATAPQLLLLDEPMAGAGTEESQRMSEIIERLRGDVAILLIEHDMDAVFRLADRITVLVEGAVIAIGTADEISNSAAVQTAYLGSE
ncbi:MAG: ABC transporter ATP-binding protein [Rhodobacteraceae bacterium]|nr:ABC transporter ATP-binding protein [Paracoccaceae bacterium]